MRIRFGRCFLIPSLVISFGDVCLTCMQRVRNVVLLSSSAVITESTIWFLIFGFSYGIFRLFLFCFISMGNWKEMAANLRYSMNVSICEMTHSARLHIGNRIQAACRKCNRHPRQPTEPLCIKRSVCVLYRKSVLKW